MKLTKREEKALMKRKQLIRKSYEFGFKAHGELSSVPHYNKEFMKTVPNCDFGDEEGVKLRTEMYKWYIKGWADANFKQVF